jgi:hypothetical protein
MKQYDVDSIKNRLVRRLQQRSGWQKIIQDSAIDNQLSAIAEGLSEAHRYFTYLAQEAKWNFSRNRSSLLAESMLFDYQPRRKVSAIGTCVFSTSNISAVNSLEDLAPYYGTDILIPKGTTITIATIPYTVSESRLLTSGTKYINVPVIQGIPKVSETGELLYQEFLRVFFNIPDIEAAIDDVSASFFSVEAIMNGNVVEPIKIYNSIYFAGEEEYACAVENKTTGDITEQGIELLFGNNVSGKILPDGSYLRLNYLESMGSLGNIIDMFAETNSIIIDNKQIYYTNSTPLIGGQDYEDIEYIRKNAPRFLGKKYSVITEQEYLSELESIPYIAKAKVFPTVYTDPILRSAKEVIGFTAINTLGEAPEEDAVVSDTLARIGKRKSPLDILKFYEPDIIDIAVNYKRIVASSISEDVAKQDIRNLIYSNYSIFSLNFQQSIAASDIATLVDQIFGNGTLSVNILAKKYIPYSEFTDTDFEQKVYSFEFHPAFNAIRKDSSVPYLLRLDVRMECPNNELYERSIFVYMDTNGAIVTKQYNYADIKNIIITTSTIQDLFNSTTIKSILPSDPLYFDIQISIITASLLSSTSFLISPNGINYLIGKNPYFEAFAYPLNFNENIITPNSERGIFRLQEKDIFIEVTHE